LREAIIVLGEGNANDFKQKIILYFQNSMELETKELQNLFDFAQLVDRGEEYDEIVVNKLYKNWVLQNNTDAIQWDKLLGDNFIDQSDTISSDTRSINYDNTTILGKSNVYGINHTLTDQEVRMLTWR